MTSMAAGQPPTFGALLRRFRRAAGLTQEDLAERARLSVETVSGLERGLSRSPHRESLALLAEALGLSAEDRSLFEATARRRDFASTSAETVAHDGSGGLPSLVDRRRELPVVDRLLDGKGPPVLLVAGPPGIGKTRLLRETVVRGGARGWSLLQGSCSRRGGQPPYACMLDALGHRLQTRTPAQLREELRHCEWLVRLLPELAQSGLPAAPAARAANAPNALVPLAPEEERRLVFGAVARYLSNTAGPAGSLVVLDDLQWADADTLDMLMAILLSPLATSMRLVGAYRDTELAHNGALAATLADLARAGLAVQLTVGPLPDGDAATLLDQLLRPLAARSDSPEVPPALLTQVVARAAGVPFFLTSFAQGLAQSLAHGLRDGALSPLDADDIPWDVAQTVRQRIALAFGHVAGAAPERAPGALSTSASEVLAAAAAANQVVSRAVLVRVAMQRKPPEGNVRADGSPSGANSAHDGAQDSQATQAVLAALDTACQAQLLVEVGLDGYRFAHNVIRDVIWQDLGAATRAALHQRLAAALEAEDADAAPETLAYHFGAGGDREKEIIYLARAGEKAQRLYAHGAAESTYRTLIERLDELRRPVEAARAREKLADVLRVTARYDEALALLDRAAQALRHSDDQEGYLRVVAQWGRVQALRGSPTGTAEGVARIRAVLATTRGAAGRSGGDEAPARGVAALQIALAELFYVNAQYSDQLAAAESAAALSAAIHDERLHTQAEQWRSSAMLFLGRADEALPILKDVLVQAQEAGDLSYHLYALNHVALAYVRRGDFAASAAYIERGLAAAQLRGDTVQVALMRYYGGVLNLYSGDWPLARSAFEEAVGLVRTVARAWTSAYPLLGLGHLCLLEGKWETASEYLQEAIAVAQRSGNLQAMRTALAPLIERDLLEGRPQVARGRLDRLLDNQATEIAAPKTALRQPGLALGPGAAQTDIGHSQALGGAEGEAEILALLAWTQMELGDLDHARESATRAEARARAGDNQLALADALRVRALLALRTRDWPACRGILEEALAQCRAMPWPYQEARVLAMCGRLAQQLGDHALAREHWQAAEAILAQLGEHLYRDRLVRDLQDLDALDALSE